MLLATGLVTIGVAGLTLLFGGMYALNVGEKADRAAATVRRGGFLYDRWPWWTTTTLYWRVQGAFFVALGVALMALLAVGLVAASHLV